MQIPLASPDITEKEIEIVNQVMNSRHLAMGPKLEAFEAKTREITEKKHAIAVNSGTSGLHLLVRALGIGEGDEVITTPFSFIASSNCILFERARPVFVDIDPYTYNMDIDKIEDKITDKTKAILPVHVFGQMMDMKKLKELADKYNLKIIEDSCEALGASFEEIKAGQLSDASVFAFYPNKQITTGEGGIIVTDNDEIAKLCRSMRNQGRGEGEEWLHHVRLGYNYRMDELSAALGVAQLERLDEILDKRKKVAEEYTEKLKRVDGVKPPYVSDKVKMSWFVYVVQVEEGIDRDSVMEYLQSQGIGCRPYFSPIHLQPFYREQFGFKEGDFPVCEGVGKRTIALPFFNNILEEEIDYVVQKLDEVVNR
ncbi:DegT/DnrJ/EryC1/StrS family aminotransferase [Natranaerofaba carboxydovora]|uniref:DegT/DnrJ/EryC1/StrS family aminotransferase n=1 Tax=Natranaerofaba carboxydovora TaxID=2742683 RepID=UPI001F1333EF|nr:DegT/DnrJ/EryC1/StrS family aminotransferase [Natranaerofaba carboxydovora]UMZ74710.1 GDP-perosamine synthase [Natranaerofaba carboxydovora]